MFWPASITPAEITTLSNDLGGRMLLLCPKQLEEVVPNIPADLKNTTPLGDLLLKNDGTLVVADYLPSDISPRSGAPSPGIWAFWWPLVIVSGLGVIASISAFMQIIGAWQASGASGFIVNAALTVAAVAVVWFISLVMPAGAILKWLAMILGAGYLLIAGAPVLLSSYLALPLILLLPILLVACSAFLALCVITEQEASKGIAMLTTIGGAGALMALPAIILSPLYLGFKAGKRNLLLALAVTLVSIVLMPLAIPLLLAVACGIAMFSHQLLLFAYGSGRDREIEKTVLATKAVATRSDLKVHEEILHAQAATAAKDDTHFFPLGVSTGLLRSMGDPLTPDQAELELLK